MKSPECSAITVPRLLDRDQAARYYGNVSTDTIDRLINLGLLPIVRLPVQRARKSGNGAVGVNRRVLIDLKDLDALIERSKETRTENGGAPPRSQRGRALDPCWAKQHEPDKGYHDTTTTGRNCSRNSEAP
jgi:hypothetical protein